MWQRLIQGATEGMEGVYKEGDQEGHQREDAV